MAHGFLVAFEGIDGSGKSTLLAACADVLQKKGLNICVTRQPRGSGAGDVFYEIIKTYGLCPLTEFFLFAADRAQHVSEVIIPELERGAIVLCDRMGDTSLAYQGYGRGVSLDLIKSVNAAAQQNTEPSLVVYCRIDQSIAALRRIKRNVIADKFDQEKQAFFDRVSLGYEKIMQQKQNVLYIDMDCDLSVNVRQVCEAIEQGFVR